eukprot:4515480-Pyramimonas_sp.AAC.1
MSDVVALHHEGGIRFGQVCFHASVDGVLFTCLSLWQTTSFDDGHARCIVREAPDMFHTRFIIEPCLYSRAAVGCEST